VQAATLQVILTNSTLMKFNNSVDNKNQDLLNQLEELGVQIEFEHKPEFDNWAVQSRYKYAIVAPNREASPESLAHELLHIRMNIMGFLNTNTITDIFKSNNCRFNTSELSTIQNILAHLKMLPEFVDMGYKVENFIANDGNEFFTTELLPAIMNFKLAFDVNKKIFVKQSINTITLLLKIIITIKHCEIENSMLSRKRIDTEGFIKMLRESDEKLYRLVGFGLLFQL
jgi:hypothetical protein